MRRFVARLLIIISAIALGVARTSLWTRGGVRSDEESGREKSRLLDA